MSQEAINLVIKYFVIFGFFIVIPLVVFMSKKPKQKNMTWKNTDNTERPQSNAASSTSRSTSKNIENAVTLRQKTDDGFINCHFNFEGKTYDAYEVLDIPAGCDISRITRAYRAKVKQGPHQEIIQIAYKTLTQ